MLPVLTALAGNFVLWLWLAIALVAWWITRGNRRRLPTLLALLALWLLGTRPVAELLLLPLEGRYEQPAVEALAERGVRQVVVLGGGGLARRGDLLSSELPWASTFRFLAGIELCTALGPDCRLILSGSAGRGRRDRHTAGTMGELARRLAPERTILAESRSGSTAEHPENVAPLLAGGEFLLVTSAHHMPRSMRTFRRRGLEPIAYPVDFLRRPAEPYGWMDWLPSADSLWKVQAAWREVLALLLYSLVGW